MFAFPILSKVVLTAVLALTIPSTSALAGGVGVTELVVPTGETGRDLVVSVWYPAKGEPQTVMFGENGIFKGAPATPDAPTVSGEHPLILLSHGSGSRVQAMGWLAVELAKAGFIVAGPNHPGTTSADSTPADTAKIWQRADDISSVIDQLTTDPKWSGLIDANRIGVAGFSLGGATALLKAGARADLEAYARYCDTYTKWDCAWFAGGIGYVNEARVNVGKVDLRALDKNLFERSNHDTRIKTAVLFDPALAQAYTAQSLSEIDIPLTFINLGDADDIPTGVIAEHLAKLASHASYDVVSGANHYSFLPECKAGALELLKSCGETEPICDEAGLRPRGEIQSDLVQLTLDALERDLKKGM